METYYSIIKISPNTMANDSLSIGLLLCDGQKYWLEFSNEKINVTKNLIGENAVAVDFVVRQLNSFIEQANKNLSSPESEIGKLDRELDIFLNSAYLNDLNKSSNGLLRFSKVAFLDDVINEEKFNKLFELLINKK